MLRGVRVLRVPQRAFSIDAVVAPVAQSLEFARAAAGVPWPVFIPLATAAVRLMFTTPLAIANANRIRTQRELAPLLSASTPVIKAQLAAKVVAKEAALTPEQIRVLAAKERRRRRVELYREFGCQNYKMLLLPAVQVPVFVVLSLAVRSLVQFDLSAITEFGNADANHFLYFRNIVDPDPWGVLPLILGGSALANVELNARLAQTGAARSRAAGMITACARFGCVVFMACSFHAPLALQLYWVSSNLFSLVQNALINRRPVPRAVRHSFLL